MGLFSFPGKSQQDADDDLDVPVKPRRSRRSPTPDEEPIDPMLPEKQRARRRLIGATALVLAAIIGLPMIFDADPNDDWDLVEGVDYQFVNKKDKVRVFSYEGALKIASYIDQHEKRGILYRFREFFTKHDQKIRRSLARKLIFNE